MLDAVMDHEEAGAEAALVLADALLHLDGDLERAPAVLDMAARAGRAAGSRGPRAVLQRLGRIAQARAAAALYQRRNAR